MVSMYTSSVTHELITPLKCISELGNVVLLKTKEDYGTFN
jgi:hypothetical protein